MRRSCFDKGKILIWFVAAFYDCRIESHHSNRTASRSRMQGRVGAPPLTHLLGEAAIASRRDAASRLNLGTPTARHPLDYEARCRAGL
jgi:hypothetical protein